MTLDTILYQKGPYHVVRAPKKGFEIYRHSGTHATRCAQIGYEGDQGLSRCKDEIERRLSDPKEKERVGKSEA